MCQISGLKFIIVIGDLNKKKLLKLLPLIKRKGKHSIAENEVLHLPSATSQYKIKECAAKLKTEIFCFAGVPQSIATKVIDGLHAETEVLSIRLIAINCNFSEDFIKQNSIKTFSEKSKPVQTLAAA